MVRKLSVVLFILLLSITAAAQPTARDHYNEGMRLLQLCVSETKSQANCKKNCQMAIGQFDEAVKLDSKWWENCQAGKDCCQKILANPYPQKKKNGVTIELPSFIPFISVSSKKIMIDADGGGSDTLSVSSHVKWDANVAEDSFLSDNYVVKNGCIIFKLDQNPSFNDRIDTVYVSTMDENPFIEKVVIVQKGSPIVINVSIDNDGIWYNSNRPEQIPAIEVAKFRDEYRSVLVEVQPIDAADKWMKDAKITLPEWCERLTERVDTRSGISSLIKTKDFDSALKYGEIYFKAIKQQKKKGSSGVARNGDIVISFQDVTIVIPIHQNQ